MMEIKNGCPMAGSGEAGGGGGASGHRPACEYTPPLREAWGIRDYPLAMVYAPVQAFRGLYDARVALSRGTLFSELDLPLVAVEGKSTAPRGGCGRTAGRERRASTPAAAHTCGCRHG